jgi:hypothetical protein
VKRHLKRYKKKYSEDRLNNGWFVMDGHAGAKFAHIMENCSPCITRSRGGSQGHYVTKLKRCMTVDELGRLQGFGQGIIRAYRQAEPDTSKLGAAFGDAMSINVLCRLIPRVLQAAGLVKRGSVRDIWDAADELLGQAAGRRMPDDLYNEVAITS